MWGAGMDFYCSNIFRIAQCRQKCMDHAGEFEQNWYNIPTYYRQYVLFHVQLFQCTVNVLMTFGMPYVKHISKFLLFMNCIYITSKPEETCCIFTKLRHICDWLPTFITESLYFLYGTLFIIHESFNNCNYFKFYNIITAVPSKEWIKA